MKYLIALALLVAPLGACEAENPVSSEQLDGTQPRDCDQPSRDDQGRPVDLC